MPAPRVLIVDDDDSVLQYLSMWFEQQAIMHECVSSCADALGLLDDHVYDLILMDIRMPEEDGISCRKTILSLHPSACIRMITGFPDDAFEAGIPPVQVVRKPFEKGQLFDMSVLASQRYRHRVGGRVVNCA